MKVLVMINPAESAATKREERRKRQAGKKQFNSDFKLEETECDDDNSPQRLHDFQEYFTVRCVRGVGPSCRVTHAHPHAWVDDLSSSYRPSARAVPPPHIREKKTMISGIQYL